MSRMKDFIFDVLELFESGFSAEAIADCYGFKETEINQIINDFGECF